MATQLHKERLVIDEKSRDEVVSHLQHCLVTLLDLSLQGKQAHWNLIGPRFRSFHRQLDEIVEDARSASDEVAERITTLAACADGRAETIANGTALSSFPDGRQEVEHCVELIADRLASTVQTIRQALEPMGELDRITEDLLIGICRNLEKHLWMVQAQHSPEDRT